jgi:hypothetical protein
MSTLPPVDMILTPTEIANLLRIQGNGLHIMYRISSGVDDAISRRETTCFRCGERGHKKQECRTWKTKQCTIKTCHMGRACPFAHSHEELRQPLLTRCVRVIRENGEVKVIGCGKVGKIYRECCQGGHPRDR